MCTMRGLSLNPEELATIVSSLRRPPVRMAGEVADRVPRVLLAPLVKSFMAVCRDAQFPWYLLRWPTEEQADRYRRNLRRCWTTLHCGTTGHRGG